MSNKLLLNAQRLHRQGKATEASRVCFQSLDSSPQNFEAYQALGKICFQSGQFDRAEHLLDEALRLKPDSLDCLNMRGVALLHLKRHPDALACFDKALCVRPDSVDTLSNRAIAYLELQEFDKAIAALDAICFTDPNHAVSWSNRGNVLVAMRRFDDAVSSYDRALIIRPDFPAALDNRKYALGMSYFEKGQFDQAQCVLDEAVRLNPRLLDALCIRGIALLRLTRYGEALACFEHVLAVEPDFVEALSNRATAYLELGRLEEATAGFDAALVIDPNHAVSWNNRGNVLTAMKRFEDAIDSYDKALSIQPNFSEAKDNRLNALFALYRMDRCPPNYIRSLFDDYSSCYDAAMVESLGYRGHLHLRMLAERIRPKLTAPLRIVDLGCGTGLVGEVFKDLSLGGRLDGIDLSPRMIEAARLRNVYDDLILGDLETVLVETGCKYDLILAADTLVYFGALGPLFTTIAKSLAPSGVFIFAVEAMGGQSWKQTPVNRFQHSEAYLRAESVRAGLTWVDLMECVIRRELNEPVIGFAVALQNPTQ
jgi:predicted TPR repeat methyltransferase